MRKIGDCKVGDVVYVDGCSSVCKCHMCGSPCADLINGYFKCIIVCIDSNIVSVEANHLTFLIHSGVIIKEDKFEKHKERLLSV